MSLQELEFDRLKTFQAPPPLLQRKKWLSQLRQYLTEHSQQIVESIRQDFKRPEQEILITEIIPTISEINHTLKHLSSWAKDQKVKTPLPLIGTKSFIRSTPKGVVLIISPWNYPFFLAITPLIAAIAAGNRVVLRPSEETPHLVQMLKKMLQSIFPSEQVQVIGGGVEVSKSLTQLPFDHIFFTGSTAVGCEIMKAAALNLTPVTLELGGKSPAIVDLDADLELAAQKLVWGKFLNAGQTCVAPDFLLVHQQIKDEFLEKLQKQIQTLYPKSLSNPEYASLIHEKHYMRILFLLDEALSLGGKLICGGQKDQKSLKIEPTVIDGITPSMKLMKEEIFGPLLPIMTFENASEWDQYQQLIGKPLALYYFGQKSQDRVLELTQSGGICLNETLLHLANPHLPFGGIEKSGMGHYHGHFGFQAFSQQRAVLKRNFKGISQFFFPPYKNSLIQTTLRYFSRFL